MYLVIEKKTWKNYLKVLYCVYMHEAPNRKRYIGITSLKPEKRWANGEGYRNQTVFYRAIKKYGWGNFKHIILEEGLSFKQACERERYYIKKYKTNLNRWQNPSYGYNRDDGGCANSNIGIPLTEECKEKLRNNKHNLNKRTPIDYFDLNGKYLGTAMTYNEAQDVTGVFKTNILKVVKGRLIRSGEYIFRYHTITGGKDIPQLEIELMCKKMREKYEARIKQMMPYDGIVYCWDVHTKQLVGNYKNVREAVNKLELGTKKDDSGARYRIYKCLEGKVQSACGYLWTKENKAPISSKDDYHGMIRPVNKYDANNNFICTFNSIADAGRNVANETGQSANAAQRNIRKVCDGLRKTCGGFKWQWADAS